MAHLARASKKAELSLLFGFFSVRVQPGSENRVAPLSDSLHTSTNTSQSIACPHYRYLTPFFFFSSYYWYSKPRYSQNLVIHDHRRTRKWIFHFLWEQLDLGAFADCKTLASINWRGDWDQYNQLLKDSWFGSASVWL
jgi:hypothetical protein